MANYDEMNTKFVQDQYDLITSDINSYELTVSAIISDLTKNQR